MMNRRKFLGGAAAVAATCASLAAFGQKLHTNASELTLEHLLRAKRALANQPIPKDYLIVLNEGRNAQRIYQLMGCPKNVYVCPRTKRPSTTLSY